MSDFSDFLKDYVFSGADPDGLTDNTTEMMRFLYGDDYREYPDRFEWEVSSEGETFVYSSSESPETAAGTQRIQQVERNISLKKEISKEARDEFNKLQRAYYAYWMNKLKCSYTGWNAGVESMVSGNGCYGCLDCQAETYICLITELPLPRHWKIVKIRIPGHSAVAVYEKEKTVQEGYVFDPWKTQTPIVYEFHEWPFALKFFVRVQS